jgi:hypothetical protein
MLEIELSNEELEKLGYEGRVDFDEGQVPPTTWPIKDASGNTIGSADVKLSDFQYIGQGRISAKYRITSLL